MPKNNFNDLAQQLAINHWNTSLATVNLDPRPEIKNQPKDEEIHKSLKHVFSKIHQPEIKNSFHNFGFTRNILIIGAGASKNAHSEISIANDALKQAFHHFGIYDMLIGCRVKKDKSNNRSTRNSEFKEYREISENELLAKTLEEIKGTRDRLNYFQSEKFIAEAFHYLKKVIDESITLGELINQLNFEGGLVVLQNFIDKKQLKQFLLSLFHHKYKPNLFYEMVAHLFKHRFIDVIVNLNFDELLDNAISDEMGEGDWIRIYNASTCGKFNQAIVDNRLRKPLYIKPHGTISDLDSLLYSTSHYIDLSTDVKNLMKNVFSGVTDYADEENEKCIRQFNIISVGYAMDDPDITSLLWSNFDRNKEDNEKPYERFLTRLYVYNPYPRDALENLLQRFKENASDEKHPIYQNLFNFVKTWQNDHENEKSKSHTPQLAKSADNQFTYHKLEISKKEKLQELDKVFFELFTKIQDHFRAPFRPSGPARHIWNAILFNRGKYPITIDKFPDKEDLKKANANFLLDRAKANLLFDFYKFNGQMPNNCIYADRAGKYYQLYLNLEQPKAKISLIDYLKNIFTDANGKSLIKENEHYMVHQTFYEACFEPKYDAAIRNKIKKEVEKTILDELKKINQSDYNLKDLIKKEFNDIDNLFEGIPFGSSHELSPNYNDQKHLRFAPFNIKQIINTNLALTWYFYKFAVMGYEDENWDKLIIISNTGTAFFNLQHYQEKKPTHIEKILNLKMGRKVLINHTNPEPVLFDKEEGKPFNFEKPKKLESKYARNTYPNLMTKEIPLHLGFHKFALFLKKDTPISAIYFCNPPNKVRINPIWFSLEDDNQIRSNQKALNKLLAFAKTANGGEIPWDKLHFTKSGKNQFKT